MRPSRLLILFLSVSACATARGPKLIVYVSDPARGQMEFYDSRTEQRGSVPYSKTDKFVCFMPNDFETFVTSCKVD